MINLRFEGIDALELHFDQMHQNEEWAEEARDVLLRRAGFRQVRFWQDSPYKVQSVQHNPRPGYILARSLDVYGRIISFVYPGDTNRADGANVWLDPATMNGSLNAGLMGAGLVYPSFYSTLPPDLRERLADLAIQAWNGRRGLWPTDAANAKYWDWIPNLATLETLAIWPKLFRRLARYFGAGYSGLGQFDTWLRADPTDRDDRILLPDGEVGNMHDLIEISGNWIHLCYWPEEIIIVPDDL